MFRSFKIRKYIPFLLLISALLFTFPLFQKGFYQSHDGELHLGRIPAFARELFFGQVPVRWSGTLNYNYGSPIFSFVYPLPYMLTSLFYLVYPSATFALKAVLFSTLLASGLAFYWYVLRWKNDQVLAIVSALLYTFLPYRMLNVYTRVALGEAVAFLFPPIIMLGGWYIRSKQHAKGVLVSTLSISALILSHNAMSLIFLLPLFLWFFLATYPDKSRAELTVKASILYLISLILGLLISAFFWIPAFLEKKYTFVEQFLSKKDFHEYFLSLGHLLHQSWNSSETTPVFWGITGILVLVLALVKVKTKRTTELLGLLTALSVSLFMTTRYSALLWEHVPVLPFFQLPWRFLSLSVWATALLVPLVITNTRNRLATLLLLLFILAVESLPATLHLTKLEAPSEFFDTYPGSTTWHEEGTPIWTAGAPSSYPDKKFTVEPSVSVTELHFSSTEHTFGVTTPIQTFFVLNHFYFPGWVAQINNEEVPIEFQDVENRGLMKVTIPQGESTLNFTFEKTKIRMLGEALSASGLVLLAAVLSYLYKNSYKSTKKL